MAELDLKVDVDVNGASKLKGLSSQLGGIAADFGKLALGVGAAFAGVGAFTANFASDINESRAKVEQVFGDWTEDIEHWAENAATQMGLSEQAALEAAGTFGNLFKAMGFDNENAVDMSEGLTQLASDLASFNNISTDEALVALRAGIVGEAEPLRKLGVNLSAARTEAKALELGLWDGEGAMSASAKAAANYALIMDDTAIAQGDFARTADGMANQQRTLSAVFQDTMADVGQAFIPLIESMLPQITAGLKAFGEWVTANMPTIQAVISGVLGGIGAAFGFLIDEVLPRAIAIFQWIAENIFPAFGTAASSIGSDIIPAISTAIGWLVTNVLPGLVAAFQAVVGWVTANMPTISSVFGQVFGAIKSVIEAVWPIVSSIATVLFPLVSTAASVLLTALDGTFKLIGGIFEVIGTVVETMVDSIEDAWKGLRNVTRNIWNGLTTVIKNAINVVIDLINGFIGFINGIQIHIPAVGVGPFQTPAFDWWGLNLGKIPRLAEGGIVDRATLALIGESGPEAVVPLDKAGMGGTEIHTHLTVYGNPDLSDTDDVERMLRRAGRFQYGQLAGTGLAG